MFYIFNSINVQDTLFNNKMNFIVNFYARLYLYCPGDPNGTHSVEWPTSTLMIQPEEDALHPHSIDLAYIYTSHKGRCVKKSLLPFLVTF